MLPGSGSALLFDIAVCLNDWCIDMDTGRLDTAVDMLERADDLFAEIAPRRDAALWPGVNSLAGMGD